MSKPAAKGSSVTKSWSQRYRTIRGERTLVKVRKVGGREQVRIVGAVNTTDEGPRQHDRKA